MQLCDLEQILVPYEVNSTANAESIVSEDLVRYMSYATSYAGYNFLVEDPLWAEDFAPNGN